MAQSWHEVGTVALHISATASIELKVGGGLGCPEGGAGEKEVKRET
jgi:hypothetical protein